MASPTPVRAMTRTELERRAELRRRLAKLRDLRARLLRAIGLEGEGPPSAKANFQTRLLAHADVRIQRIERALRPRLRSASVAGPARESVPVE